MIDEHGSMSTQLWTAKTRIAHWRRCPFQDLHLVAPFSQCENILLDWFWNSASVDSKTSYKLECVPCQSGTSHSWKLHTRWAESYTDEEQSRRYHFRRHITGGTHRQHFMVAWFTLIFGKHTGASKISNSDCSIWSHNSWSRDYRRWNAFDINGGNRADYRTRHIFTRYSSLLKFLRVSGYVLRFIHNMIQRTTCPNEKAIYRRRKCKP